MAQLPLNDGIERFKQNEERVDLFVNSDTSYLTNEQTPRSVESLPALMARLKTRYLNVVHRGNWAASSIYDINDIAKQSDIVYLCVEPHTAGTFATDLTNGKWVVYQGVSYSDLAASSGAGFVGWIRSAVGSIATTIAKWLGWQSYSVFEFMTDVQIADVQSATPSLDHTSAILAAKAHVITKLPCKLKFPKGLYRYTDIGNWAYNGLTIEGEEDRGVVFKCTSSTVGHKAFKADAFASGSPSSDFVQRCNVKNIIFEGNSNTDVIVEAQGLARSKWENVYAREANSTTGIAFKLRGVMLSIFDNVMCSQDLDAMTSPPSEGFRLEAGIRAGENIGNCSNNVFVGLYAEGSGLSSGMKFGVRLAGADQNVFIGGSHESCYTYGLLVGTDSRYNTFIGTGFENLNSTADIADAGKSTKFINCYASQNVILQGRSAEISGGYFERILIDSGAIKNRIHDVLINGWATGAGGFYDNGTATEWKNIYDNDAGSFIYPLKDRVGLSLSASPCAWQNNTGQYVEVIINGGVVTAATMTRNGITWDLPAGSPNCWLVAPTDVITLTYTGSPTKFWYIPHNGFQG